MSRSSGALTPTGDGFPRVSGDEPWISLGVRWRGEFSPRERG